jgi:hypothetical protein
MKEWRFVAFLSIFTIGVAACAGQSSADAGADSTVLNEDSAAFDAFIFDGSADVAFPSDADGGDELIDAGTDVGGDEGCNAIALGGPVVTKTPHAGPPPAMTGGPISEGTYFLTAIDTYNHQVGAGSRQETWILSGGSIQIVARDSTLSSDVRGTGTYSTSGNMLTMALSCPAPVTTVQPFTATSLAMEIINAGNANEMHTFSRQP